jgi:hypothetical protein
MKSTVGISHRLKRAWLDDLLDRLVQTQDEKELRAFVDQRLRDELPGKDARAKAAGILLRIWCRVDVKHLALRDRAVALLPGISGQERIWLHWGMAALAYPFFRDLAEVIGRILTLQDDITNAQVQSRLKTAWGDRETSKEAAGKLITSMVDWEVLRATKTKGQFLLARKMTTSVTELQMWLLEAMLSASASDEIEAQQLLRLPELFPFALTVGVGNLRKHEGFNIHRQGLDMDMVSTRHVKVEPPQAKQKKSKKRESDDPNQATLIDDSAVDSSEVSRLVTGPNSGEPQRPVVDGQVPSFAVAALFGDRGFDLTFPKTSLTGLERSLVELTQPDERSSVYRLDVETLQAPYLAAESLLPVTVPPMLRERITVARNLAVYAFFCYEFHAVSMFWAVSCIEMALKQKFEEVNPGPIALRRKLDGNEEVCQVALVDLEEKLRLKWKLVDLPFFDYSFKALLTWAFRKQFLPDDIHIPVQEIVNGYNNRFAFKVFPDQAQKNGLLGKNPTMADIKACWDRLSDAQRKHYQAKASTVLIEELPKFRNMMAHPKRFTLVTPPGSPLATFQLLTDIAGLLWRAGQTTSSGEKP